MSISLVTWVIDIAQEAYSTLKKALYNSNFSLENIQNQNPTVKTIKMRLKLVGWCQQNKNSVIFLYYPIIHIFLVLKL